MLHIVGMLQVLHMVAILQMLHMVGMLHTVTMPEMLLMVDTYKLLPNHVVESFWDALWLGIHQVSSFKCRIS